MECIDLNVEELHLGFLDPDALFVAALVEGTLDLEPGFGCCRANQFDDRHAALQRFPAPVLCDVAKHPMLDLVPFRGPRRIVVDLLFELFLEQLGDGVGADRVAALVESCRQLGWTLRHPLQGARPSAA